MWTIKVLKWDNKKKLIVFSFCYCNNGFMEDKIVKSNNKLDKMQVKAKSAALKALKKTGKTLLHMATGTGKTETATKIFSEYTNKNKRVLWLTHKNDLVEQSAERIIDRLGVDTTLFCGSEKDTSGQVVVSSVQSLSKTYSLEKFSPNDFDLIVVDEAHHAPATSWTKVIEYFKADRLALTATPYRPDDRKDLVFELFGKPSFSVRFSKAQKEKLLAPEKARVILTNSALDGFKGVNKDFTEKQLEKIYSSNDRNKIIVNSYLEYGREEVIKSGMKPKAICFCINTKHAKRMSQLFNKVGVKAGFLSSKISHQSAKKRVETFETFRTTNDLEVLCTVDILNEGTDIPDVNIGLMARPTRSSIVYTQQVGRLARSNNGKKKFFMVLDYVDNTSKGWNAYTVSNLTDRRYYSNEIVTKYVHNPDPVVVNERRENIMKSVEDFEDELSYDILKTKEELRKEALYFKKFGKHTKEFLNENKIKKSASKN